MTPLASHLIASITQTGPITIADFMASCLLHPVHGYYTTRDPLGAEGDFTTAPEISQMFGELIGLTLAKAWMDQGRPGAINVCELGPGRGTLMADVLRATAHIPGFDAALAVHFVEASPKMRAAQGKRVPDANWHDQIETIPQGPLYVVANEFFDALPIRQFQRAQDGWRERLVGVVDGQLSFGLGDVANFPVLKHRIDDTKPGDLVEYCPDLPIIVQQISIRIKAHGGLGLVIDYGDWGAQGDTLQAVKGHDRADPLAEPGLADLTAHVDFAEIARAATDTKYTRLTTQGVFLERLGITERAQVLARGLTDERLASHIAAHRRLTHPAEMGHLFKVMGLYPDNASPPPGLDP